MKILFLFITMVLLPMVARADNSGTCGDNLTWTYNKATKTLTISGSGDMNNFYYNFTSVPNESNDYYNTPWNSFNHSIEKVVLDDGVTSIGRGAFYNCKGLISINIPNSVMKIGHSAFYGTAWFDYQPDGLIYAGRVAYKYKGIMPNNTSITIAEGTTGIAESAFDGCGGLISITIPNTVADIGDYAFANDSALVSIIIPNSVVSIGDDAFNGCKGLTSITISNSVISIGDDAFNGCKGLTSITIPNSVISIGKSAFFNCIGLISLNIPNSVIDIGNQAFRYCSGLTSVTIHNNEMNTGNVGKFAFADCSNLTTICIGMNVDNYAFYRCFNLQDVKIDDGVERIGDWAFSDCSSLNHISLGSNVKYIGEKTFSNCTAVTHITSHAQTPPKCSKRALYDINKLNCILTIPIGKIVAYRSAEQWKEFYFMEEFETGITKLTSDKSTVEHYFTIDGKRLDKLQKGVNIVVMKDGTVRKVVMK